jgi:hypothetical protein
MAENNNAAIHIGQFNLRMPGTNADTALRVANGVGQGLAQKVQPGMQRQLGALSVRIPVPVGATEAEVIDAVARAIMRALRK